MNLNQIEHEPGFNVIGIAIRTSNNAAFSDNSIGNLWQRFFAESVFATIPHKIDHAIVAVYYDFATDRNGEYNLLLGARVSSIDEIPMGMIAYHVPSQKRAIFVSESGPVGQVCFDLWKKIWLLEDENKLNRAYSADYELYDERSKDRQNAQVAIYIGIKST